MDLNFSPDDDAFREAIRAFIGDHYPPEMRVANPYTDLTKQQMLLARVDVRRALGIAPDAPSQLVVEALLQFAWQWQGNPPGGMQVLTSPVSTLPPQQTLLILSNLPYVQSANIASSEAATQMLPGGAIARR